VRRPESRKPVEDLGPNVRTVEGSFDDLALIEQHTREADVVVNTADSDTVPLIEAILAGQRKRAEVDGKPRGALLHTSGGAIFLDSGSQGVYDPNGKVWKDGDPEDIRAISTSMIHGQVDVPILQAGEAGYVETHIICPGGIFGEARGPVKAGSLMVKSLLQLGMGRQRACYFGEGTNTLFVAEVNDLVDLYQRVFARILSGADEDTSPYERYYIGAVNPLTFKTVMTAVGEELVRHALLEDATPESISVDEVSNPFLNLWARSQRLEPTRGKSIGWNPKPVDIKEHLSKSIDAVLQNTHQKS